MGLIRAEIPMSQPTLNIAYSHKKFKRRTSSSQQSTAVAQDTTTNVSSERDYSPDVELTSSIRHDQHEGQAQRREVNDSKAAAQRYILDKFGPQKEQRSLNGGLQDTRDQKHEIPPVHTHLIKCTLCSFICTTENEFQRHSLLHVRQPSPCQRCGALSSCSCLCSNEPLQLTTRKLHHQTAIPSNSTSSFSSVIENNSCIPADLSLRRHLSEYDASSQRSRGAEEQSHSISENKSIYKPKFRPSYSVDPSAMISSVDDNCFSTRLVTASDSTTMSVDISRSHSLQSAPYQSNVIGLVNANTDFHNKKTPRLASVASASPQPAHLNEEYNHNIKVINVTTQWKDMPADPSPDLRERIDKIIVQNQEIMDADNILLGRKFRRQPSVGANEGEGTNKQSRKQQQSSSESKPKCASQGNVVHRVSRNSHPPELTASVLPSGEQQPNTGVRSYKRSASVQPVGSATTFLTHGQGRHNARLSQQPMSEVERRAHASSIQDQDLIRQHILSMPNSETSKILLTKGHSLALQGTSIVPISTTAFILPSGSGRAKEVLDVQTERSANPPMNTYGMHRSFSIDTGAEAIRIPKARDRILIEQEAALDLQKKPHVKEILHNQLRGGSLGPEARVQHEHSRMHKSLSPFVRQHSLEPAMPPNKKRRLSSDPPLGDFIYRQSTQPVLLHNGNILHRSSKTILEETARKPNMNQLCGGEVKICDGTEYKTIKIDTSECGGHSLAMDMCIVSPSTSETRTKITENVPTSVVVTLSKSGLNCGGTVVESKVSNVSKMATSIIYSNVVEQKNSLSAVNDYGQQGTDNESHIRLKRTKITPSVPQISLSSLQQYAPQLQLPNLAIPGVPTPNFTGGFLNKISGTHTSTKPKLGIPHNDIHPDSHVTGNGISLVQNPLTKSQVTPTILSVGKEKVPYVPGIPGPYSQASPTVVQLTTLSKSPAVPPKLIPIDSCKMPPVKLPSGTDLSFANARKLENSDTPPTVKREKPVLTLVPPSPIPTIVFPEDNRLESKKSEDKTTKVSTTIVETVTDSFLMPKKRPDSLALKPHNFVPKSSSLLIGTTIMSPDTPRPKKSCAQLLLNGSAYTYLGLKVSTKTYYCCIYRPQPMYVPHSPDSKVSMYSNWQIRKPAEDNPFNLSISKLMGLYSSKSYTNRAFTIAASSDCDMVYTFSNDKIKEIVKDSDTKTSIVKTEDELANKSVSPEPHCSTISEEDDQHTTDGSRKQSEPPSQGSVDGDEIGSGKRIRIFDGGFKSTEDYTYIRGRGRGRYVCETCGIRCKKPSMLKKHIRTHTNLRPYPCMHCTSRFKTKGNLTKHLKSKAHYKRCLQLGVSPELPASSADEGSADHDEDFDEDDDEDGDEDCDDEMEDDDEDDMDYDRSESRSRENSAETMTIHRNSVDGHTLPLVTVKPPDDKDMKMASNGDIPMDLTVKKDNIPTSQTLATSRPTFLALASRNPISSPTVKSPHLVFGGLPSPHTPLTPIREQPCDILSPVTDSSMLLKSIYSTTERTAKATSAMTIENSGVMMKKYLTERAIQDTFMKRHQYQGVSSSQTVDSKYTTATMHLVASNSAATNKAQQLKDSAVSGSLKPKSYYSDKWLGSTAKSKEEVSNMKAHVPKDSAAKSVTGLSSCEVSDSKPMSELHNQVLPEKRESLETKQQVEQNSGKVLQLKSSTLTENKDPESTVTSSAMAASNDHVTSGSGLTHKATLLKSTAGVLLNSSSHSNNPDSNSLHNAAIPKTENNNCFLSEPSKDDRKSSPKPPSPIAATSLLSKYSSLGTILVSSSTPTSLVLVTTTSSSARTSSAAPPNPCITSASLVSTSAPTSTSTITTLITPRTSAKSSKVVGPTGSIASEPPAGRTTGPSSAMNLTVLNTSGTSGTSFLSPSGMVPTSSNSSSSPEDGRNRCNICDKEFQKSSQLNLHMNIHYIERPFRCNACAVSFRTNGHLQKHKRSALHFNKMNMNLTFGAASMDNPRPFKCHDCKVAFRIHGHLAKHLRSKLHILKLECLGKLPFGVYAEMERTGSTLATIDTTDCENSLISLQALATKLFASDPAKLDAWHSGEALEARTRTTSNSSANSEDYPLEDDDPQMGDSDDNEGHSSTPNAGGEHTPPSPSPAPTTAPSKPPLAVLCPPASETVASKA